MARSILLKIKKLIKRAAAIRDRDTTVFLMSSRQGKTDSMFLNAEMAKQAESAELYHEPNESYSSFGASS